ncbi:MAG: dolichyl-phosphate-mannose--protein mannosyltransferase, partial [Actinomycetia bacterium]|nr:dolichyl-phosphate-mannose--protein mannosyltransferase [Actinomycetes bacterium]
SLWRDGVPAFVYLVVVGFGTYVATWASWFATSGGYYRNWGAENPTMTSVRWLGNTAASWWHYQAEVWGFHTGEFMKNATHPYDAKPWGWLVIARPISFAYDTIQPGVDGCHATGGDTCTRAVLAIGTPFLWWMAALALIAALVFWLAGRDWRFAVPLLAGAATWLGWFPNDQRPLFFFYAIMIIPFSATILAMCLGKILGPPSAGRRRQRGAIVVTACVVLIVANFAFIYPILTDQLITHFSWSARMWFPRWI